MGAGFAVQIIKLYSSSPGCPTWGAPQSTKSTPIPRHINANQQLPPQNWSSEAVRYEREISNAGRYKLDFAKIDKCKPVLLRLSLAGNLEKNTYVLFLYGTEWRERGCGLCLPDDIGLVRADRKPQQYNIQYYCKELPLTLQLTRGLPSDSSQAWLNGVPGQKSIYERSLGKH